MRRPKGFELATLAFAVLVVTCAESERETGASASGGSDSGVSGAGAGNGGAGAAGKSGGGGAAAGTGGSAGSGGAGAAAGSGGASGTGGTSGSGGASGSGAAAGASTGGAAGSGGTGTGGASGLDPDLSLPDPGGSPCTTPGSMGECPSLQVCRISAPDAGRCESCVSCGNLNSPCSSSSECDILFQCYAGRCTNICPLGSSYCGAVQDCLDVGHATHGVCNPY